MIPGVVRPAGEEIGYPPQYSWASPVAQMVKNLPAMQDTWVRFLGWEDPLEKEMATHSSILAWKILWTEESGGVQSMGWQVIHNLGLYHHHSEYAPWLQLRVCMQNTE